MSDRTARLDELLREEISGIITREIADPRIGFVTVTKVEVTGDLAHANVWVSIIGDEAARRASLRALGNAMPFVRHRLGVLRIKRVPDLHVRHDDAAERATRVLRLLHEIEEGSEVAPAPDVEALPAPEPVRGIPTPPVKRVQRPGPRPTRAGDPKQRARRGDARGR